jgi:hypothetical protein
MNSVTVSVYMSIYYQSQTGTYRSLCDQNNLKAWIPYQGYFLFEFLPIGREEQNGGMI